MKNFHGVCHLNRNSANEIPMENIREIFYESEECVIEKKNE